MTKTVVRATVNAISFSLEKVRKLGKLEVENLLPQLTLTDDCDTTFTA